MSITSHRPNEEAYEVMSQTDEDDRPLSASSVADVSKLLGSKSAIVQMDRVQPVGSLSRNEHRSWYFLGHGAVDAILSLGPVLFLVVPAMCLGLNNKQISSYGETVKAITLLSPTIFPIIYAAILGRMLRRVGMFMAERGTTLGNLERLIGCQSVFSALERQISFRRFDLLGIVILVAWLLSPLGGQASLRLLSTKPLVVSYDSSIIYYPIEYYPKRTYIRTAQTAQENWPRFAPLYMTAIQTSRQSLIAPMDIFGGVKIPDINCLRQNNTAIAATDYSWQIVSNATLVNYTSILGVPIGGVPASGNCTFDLISHYWAVNCTPVVLPARPLAWRHNIAQNTTYHANKDSQGPTFQILIDHAQSTHEDIRFEYLSKLGSNTEKNNVASANCSTSPVIVESQVKCHDRSCHVHAMRRTDRRPVDVWNGTSPKKIFQHISEWMPGADLGYAQSINSTSELIEHWMMNTDLGTLGSYEFVNLTHLSFSEFNNRFQTAINTFWDATIGSSVRLNSLGPGADTTWADTTSWASQRVQPTQYKGEVYSCNMGLALLTIAISLTLFAAANISMLLGLLTRTPDILGFVSASARDNPYFKQHVTSYLSGLENARILCDVRVRIGDVKSEENIGHIALASMDADPKKLSWTRMYD